MGSHRVFTEPFFWTWYATAAVRGGAPTPAAVATAGGGINTRRRSAHVRLITSRLSRTVVAAVVSVALGSPAAHALTTVTNTADSGAGSLRQAIADAPAGDTIAFAGSVTGTITLTTGALIITKDVTISGPGMGVLAVSGNQSSGVFSINSPEPSGLTVTLSGLTIRDGSAASAGGGIFGGNHDVSVSGCAFTGNVAPAGGAIFIKGTLSVTNSTFEGNSAEGNGGAVEVGTGTFTNSTFERNSAEGNGGAVLVETGTFTNNTFEGNNAEGDGGAVLVVRTGTFTNSTFTNNTAALGGGVFADPTYSLTVSGCTFSRNTAFVFGGAILSDEEGTLLVSDSTFDGNQSGVFGGAIYRDADLTLSNSTFSGNRSHAGTAIFIDAGGRGVIANCTFTGNSAPPTTVPGAAIYVAGAVSVRNTIVANNTPANCAEALASDGHNLDSGTSCGFTATGDLSSTDPRLGPLASNGGPTRTHALLPGSPAIDAGDPAAPGSGGTACEASDQRGVTRPHFAACDIGAYESTCGDTVVDAAVGEQCDDGNLVDGDGCDSNCTLTGCGNGIVTAGEQCDDGNTLDGDCCSSTCQFESTGTLCPIAGSPCTDTYACDGAGRCVRGPQASCQPGKPIVGGKALVLLKANTKASKNQLKWKWLKGAATTLDDFGVPTATTDYLLCVYDGTGLVSSARAPAGGLCSAGKPCWKKTKKGFKYNDKDRTPDGIRKINLKAGEAGKAKVILKAKGALLDMPFPGALASPLTVQLRNSSGSCWEAIYSFPPAKKNTAAQFKDTSD